MMDDIKITNFCACFLDLLGQRDAQKGEGLLPIFTKSEDELSFQKTVIESLGTIRRLQENVKHFMNQYPDLSIRDQLNSEQQEAYDKTKSLKMKLQRWSDGLVLYTSMQGDAPMNAIWDIVCTAGALCFMGLAERRPLRGGIDISWGAELYESELYGPIIANTYELESTVAQCPRIVVSNRLVDYLKVAVEQADRSNPNEAVNAEYAQICSKMLIVDVDGQYIIDYLGEIFTKVMFTQVSRMEIFEPAYKFISAQYELYKMQNNQKLASRYKWILNYYYERREIPSPGDTTS